MRGLVRRVFFDRSSWGTSVLGICHAAQASPHTSPQWHLLANMRLLAKAVGRPRASAKLLGSTSIYGRRHLTNNGFFRVSEEVREALNSGKPVVALETTIYTHGRSTHASNYSIIADRTSRISISRKRSSCIPPRERSPHQWWSARNYRHIRWCGTCWHGSRRADKVGFVCRQCDHSEAL
jgi:hypothetical protein